MKINLFIIFFISIILFSQSCNDGIGFDSHFDIKLVTPNPAITSDTLSILVGFVEMNPEISQLSDVSVNLIDSYDQSQSLKITGIFYEMDTIGTLHINQYTQKLMQDYHLIVQCDLTNIKPGYYKSINLTNKNLKSSWNNTLLVFSK